MAASKTRKSAQSQAHKSIGVIRLTAELYNPDTDQVETKAFELKIPKEQLVAANDLDSFTKLMSDSETIVQEAGTEIMSLCMKSIASQAGAQYQKPKKKKQLIRLLTTAGGMMPVNCPMSVHSPKTIIKTDHVKDLMLYSQTVLHSYREACSFFEKCYPGFQIRPRTLHDFVSSAADEIHQAKLQQREQILSAVTTVDPCTGEQPKLQVEEQLPPLLSGLSVGVLSHMYNSSLSEDAPKIPLSAQCNLRLEASYSDAVYIRPDDIGVKRQKEKRGTDRRPDELKTVQNSIIHVEWNGHRYIINESSMRDAFLSCTALLIRNGCLNKRLVVLTDGARNITQAIQDEWFPMGLRPDIILDWFHLEKRCYELLSSAYIGSKDYKRNVLTRLKSFLWINDQQKAKDYIAYLISQHPAQAKKLTAIIDYLDRKSPYLTCYALRKYLGLTTSSNRVEKANDMVVAARQKHQGMSWSKLGSTKLASISAAYHNKLLCFGIENGFAKVDWFSHQPTLYDHVISNSEAQGLTMMAA